MIDRMTVVEWVEGRPWVGDDWSVADVWGPGHGRYVYASLVLPGALRTETVDSIRHDPDWELSSVHPTDDAVEIEVATTGPVQLTTGGVEHD